MKKDKCRVKLRLNIRLLLLFTEDMILMHHICLKHDKSNIISIKLFFTLFESGLNTCLF